MIRFKLAGIPVAMHWTFFLFAALIGAAGREDGVRMAAWVVVVFVSVLLHELGHAFAWRAYGHQPSIELQGLGGATRGDPDRPLPPGKQALVALAGPVTGLLLAAVAFVVGQLLVIPRESLGARVLYELWWANTVWSVFNLLPVIPLDGGIIVASLERRVRGGRPPRAAFYLSVAVGAGLALYFATVQQWIAVLLLASYAYQAFQTLRALSRVEADAPHPALAAAMVALKEDRLDDARAAAQLALMGAKKDVELNVALHIIASVHTRQGRPDDALNILLSMPRGLKASPLALGEAWTTKGEHLKASTFFRDAFRDAPVRETAYRYARSLLDAGLDNEMRELLTSQASLGYSDETCAGLQDALYERGKFEESSRVGAHRHQKFGSAAAAYNAACALVKLGRNDDAMKWLTAAADKGFRDVKHLDEDPDLAPLRGSAAFDALRQRLVTAPA
ncbi:MAG: hypothetical protein HY904_09995 [Deltaproteobacteria bacterium]|nr:hypothetical protein [Deltaproteobacteria bacterium]